MTVTRTTNRLHFSDLDPLRYEDLCVNLAARHYDWKELLPVGRNGNDGGVDILGQRIKGNKAVSYHIQCKRYSTINKRDIKLLIDKIGLNNVLPDVLWLIVSCDISRVTYEYFKDYAATKGIKEVELWPAQTLEEKLYSNYPDLLMTYFGLGVRADRDKNIKKVKAGLKMEKRVEKLLIDMDFIKNPANRDTLINDPSSKFISDSVFIRSVDDDTYPELPILKPGEFNPYYLTYFYNLYEKGIEFWLGAGKGTYVIMNDEGFWEPVLNSNDNRLKDSRFKVIHAKQIGRIAYHDIVELKPEGDNRYTCPHLFCRFDYDGMPYEEVYFKSDGTSKGSFDWDFDKSKRTSLQ